MSGRCARREAASSAAIHACLLWLLSQAFVTAQPQRVLGKDEPTSEAAPVPSTDASSSTGQSTSPTASTPPTNELINPEAATSASSLETPSSPAEPPPPPGYNESIERAIDEHERGHFEEAREHFRAAHEMFRNARTFRGLGKVEFELRNYGESVKYLNEALESRVKPLTPELRDEVQAILARARAYVGQVHVDVQPGSATVSVDGITVATGPQAALALLVGDHILEFRAAGRLPERRQIRVHGGDQIDVQVVLPPPESALIEEHHHIPAERRPSEAPTYRKWWVWTTATVVAAGTVTAIVLATRDREVRTREPQPRPGTWSVKLP